MKQQFDVIAFTYLTTMLYYDDYAPPISDRKALMQQGMKAFDGIALRFLRQAGRVRYFAVLSVRIHAMFISAEPKIRIKDRKGNDYG